MSGASKLAVMALLSEIPNPSGERRTVFTDRTPDHRQRVRA